MWRIRALWTAFRALLSAGGTDLAASLAFYTAVSLLPLVALAIMLTTTFLDGETVRTQLGDLFANYFPASQGFLDKAIDNLFRAPLASGAIAVVSAVWGGNGLFTATIRTVNRVYGFATRRYLSARAIELGLAALVLLLFLASIGVSVLLRLSLDITKEVSASAPMLDWMVTVAMRLLLTVIPLVVTGIVFLLVYRTVPNGRVRWCDAAYGAVVAAIMFEVAKLAFFWFASVSVQRNLLYGPLSSALVLLLWSHLAAMIFLYGVSLTRSAGDLRPEPS